MRLSTLLLGKLSRTKLRELRHAADAARDRGDWITAIGFYEEVVAMLPDNPAMWVQLGHMRKEAGRHAEAELAYERALAIDPDNADTHINVGHLHKISNDYERAVAAYRRSLALGHPEASGELQALNVALDTAYPPPKEELVPLKVAVRTIGSVDGVNGREVIGWAVDPEDPSRPVEIEFRARGRVIGRTETSMFRSDVAEAGFGTAHAGYQATLALDSADASVVTVQAYLRESGYELAGSPFETTGFSPRTVREGNPVTSARFAFAKRLRREAGRETAVFVTHSPDGVLKPHVKPYLAALAENGIAVLLVVVADRPTRIYPDELALVAGAMVRENVGYDFAAWAHAIRLHPEVYDSPILYLLNDSMFGPNTPEGFEAVLRRVRTSSADLVGLTENHESGWHIQSFFMAFKASALSSWAVQRFFNSIVNLPGKQDVIDTYEIAIGPMIEANGMRAEALFRTGDPLNATMFGWRELIRQGFPFVKTLLFRKKSFLFDVTGWEEFLEGHGFDAALLKDVLKHHNVTGLVPTDFPLLAMPADDAPVPGLPLKIDVFGPWNYDNGLGQAGRAIAAAIRATGAQVNMHPVEKPFHIHRPLTPPHAIIDFEGPADIAVIHLNPDSWQVLTPAQRARIAAAGKRIGYWVWEMAHIPQGWRQEFGSVDRIWAPSSYCADLFRAQNEAPVDVVPHPVPLPAAEEDRAAIRAAVLDRLGLPADRRTILYAFDGSSYLARKNPMALVRAFAASGLIEHGWNLVLKTKHLLDNVEQGTAFRSLCEDTAGVVLLDATMSRDELRQLFAAADIYASPHSSEGFGLTIAEAMAAGKPVVATDYSGSTDFLDADSGYPVAAEVVTLERGFGHYTAGGQWAVIDEEALRVALADAAAAIERGDHAKGEAARARIGAQLSIAHVASLVDASFRTVLAGGDRPRWPLPPPLTTSLGRGVPPVAETLGDTIAHLPLASGTLSPDGSGLDRVGPRADRWLLIAPADARCDPNLRSIVTAYANSRPDVAIFYGDDIAAGEATLNEQLRLKPEWDRSLFLAQDYIGAPLLVRGSALHALGGLDPALGDAALTDLVMRAQADGKAVARIPHVLTGVPGKRACASAEGRRAVLASHPQLAGFTLAPGLVEGALELRRAGSAFEPVTLVVPTRRSIGPDGRVFVERLIDSLAMTDWPLDRLTVLIGDDVPGTPDWATRSHTFRIERIETPRAAGEPFNFSAKMNRLWRAAETEHIVLLNDDVVIEDAGWLRALMTFATAEDVGAAGPLLFYDDRSVQHAGIVCGLYGVAAHAWLRRPTPAGTYQDWALVHREWSTITGACIATRRAVLDLVGGFDEGFAVEFNDIDLCLKMRSAGLRVVYTPHARMTHSEKASRGPADPPPRDAAMFLKRWREWLADDPAFHPRLNHYRFDLEPAVDGTEWFAR